MTKMEIEAFMKYKILMTVLLVWLFVMNNGLSHATDFGPYKGKIIDVDTKAPIEGVVVLVEWWEIPFFGGPKYIDAQETLTDKNGSFIIHGIRVLNPMKRIGADVIMTIFKSGYQSHEWNFQNWEEISHDVDGSILKGEDGNPLIILKQLTMEERREHSAPGEPSVTGNKYHVEKKKWVLLRLERNKERKILGLDELIDSDGFGRR